MEEYPLKKEFKPPQARRYYLFNNPSDLRFKTHVQHSIGFVQTKEPTELEAYFSPFKEICQSTGSSYQKVAAAGKIAELLSDVSTTVNHTGADLEESGRRQALASTIPLICKQT